MVTTNYFGKQAMLLRCARAAPNIRGNVFRRPQEAMGNNVLHVCGDVVLLTNRLVAGLLLSAQDRRH